MNSFTECFPNKQNVNYEMSKIFSHDILESTKEYLLSDAEVLEETVCLTTKWHSKESSAVHSFKTMAKNSGANLICIQDIKTMKILGVILYSVKGMAGMYSIPKKVEDHEVEEYSLKIINQGNKFATKFRNEARTQLIKKGRQELLLHGTSLGLKVGLLMAVTVLCWGNFL